MQSRISRTNNRDKTENGFETIEKIKTPPHEVSEGSELAAVLDKKVEDVGHDIQKINIPANGLDDASGAARVYNESSSPAFDKLRYFKMNKINIKAILNLNSLSLKHFLSSVLHQHFPRKKI